MRLRSLQIALVVGISALPLSTAADTVSNAVRATSVPSSQQIAYLGVMGEVPRPGVYSTSARLTLAELVAKAGGVTRGASGSARVFRGGRLAVLVFLGSGTSTSLFPGDLVVIERRNPDRGTVSRRHTGAANSPEVQIAFLNLIDRPVVLKMIAEIATVSHIVELLGQRTDLAAKVRVIPPAGSVVRDSGSNAALSRPLESGTVLVFSGCSIRSELLPALGEPIGEKVVVEGQGARPPAVAQEPASQGIETRPSHSVANVQPVPTAFIGKCVPNLAPPPLVACDSAGATEERFCEGAANQCPSCSISMKCGKLPKTAELDGHTSPSARTTPTARLARRYRIIDPESAKSEGGLFFYTILSVVAALAVLAMFMTLASMVRRSFEPAVLISRLRNVRNIGKGRGPAAVASTIILPHPLPDGVAGFGQPVRIDASQPLTRLGIDLAIVERFTSTSRKTAGIRLPENSDRRKTA